MKNKINDVEMKKTNGEEGGRHDGEAKRLTRRLLWQYSQMWQSPLSRKHMCTNKHVA